MSGRGKEDQILQELKCVISGLRKSPDKVLKMAINLNESKNYVESLLLFHVSNELHEKERVSCNDAAKWIRNLVCEIWKPTGPLIKAGGRSRDFGMSHGFEFMGRLIFKLNGMKDVNPDVRAAELAKCLVNMTFICIRAGEYEKMIQFGRKGVSVMDEQFGSNASKHGCYGQLLNNLGAAYEMSGRYSEAADCYSRSARACEKAADFSEKERTKWVEITRKNLNDVHKKKNERK